MRFTRMLLIGMLVLLCSTRVMAQTAGTIAIGDTITGTVTSSTAAPSFFFNASTSQVLTIQLTTTSSGFMPVLLIADDQNYVVETFSDATGGRVGGTITIPAEGRYFVQVQGANGSQGEFSLSVLEGDIPIDIATPTPTSAATAAVETTAEADGAIQLQPGDTIESNVDLDVPEHQFGFTSTAAALIVVAQGSAGSVTLTSEAGEIIGLYQTPVEAGAFVVPPSSGSYTLTVSHTEGEARQSFTVALSEYSANLLLQQATPTTQPAPTLPPTPEMTPTSLPPQDVDALLTWSDTALMFTNVSGAALDIRMLTFTGDNRSVDMTFWAQSNPALDLSVFPPDTCAGYRPLAYPDAPPLAPGCVDLAAWWSADIVHFWGGDSFDVRYNGAVIATCPTSDGQCGIDLPDA